MSDKYLSVPEARATILDAITPLGTQRVMLDQAADRILAEDVQSPIDWPRFTNSAMDGYGVRWDDIQSLPARLEVQGEIPAGSHEETPLEPGHAYRIMTGAPVAPGIDTVVMRERTNEDEDGVVVVEERPSKGKGANIRHQGEDFATGDTLFGDGTVVDSGILGLLASFGRCQVSVYRQPRVTIISTGDELVELDAPPGDGQIINSSSYMLSAMVRRAGGIPNVLPIVRDRQSDIEAAFDEAQRCSDLVVSIGGVSMGDFDLVQQVILDRSPDIQFWKIAMKPGKPLAFGMVDAVPLLGLPGNPVSSFVTFLQFVRPAIRRLQHASDLTMERITATLTRGAKGPRGRTEFARGQLTISPSGATFTPLERQGSGNLHSVANINGLGVLPPGSRFSEGDQIEVEILR